MTAPDTLVADLPGLRQLSGDLDEVTAEVEEITKILHDLPQPDIATYGWQCTVDAVQAVLDAWTAEVEMLRQACDLMSRNAARSANEIAGIDALTGDELSHLLADQ